MEKRKVDIGIYTGYASTVNFKRRTFVFYSMDAHTYGTQAQVFLYFDINAGMKR